MRSAREDRLARALVDEVEPDLRFDGLAIAGRGEVGDAPADPEALPRIVRAELRGVRGFRIGDADRVHGHVLLLGTTPAGNLAGVAAPMRRPR